MGLLLIFTGLVALLLGMLVSQGHDSLMAIALGCMLFNFGLNTFLWRLNRRYIIYKFFAVWFVYQPFFLFLLLVLFPDDMREQVASFLPIEGKSISLFASFCVVPLLAVLLTLAIDRSRGSMHDEAFNYAGQRIKPTQSSFALSGLGSDFDMVLIFSAIISVSIWGATLSETNIFAFFVRVLYRGVFFMPFIAGLYWNRNRLVRLVWLECLTINMVLAFITGSRGYGFLPLGLYGLGFIVQQTTRSRRILWIVAGLAGAFPLLLLGGLIQVLRDEVGRTNLQSMRTGEIISHFGDALDQSVRNNVNTWDETQNSALWFGLSRLLDWSLIAVPNMSPGFIAYRGYGDFPSEIEGMFSVPGLDIFPELGFDSRSLAIPYGFGVSSELDVTTGLHVGTSVPFNIVADSWSRGGFFSLLVQVSVSLFALLWMEVFLYKYFLMRNYVNLFVLGRTVLIGMAFNYLTGNIFTDTIRQCIFTMGFTLLCVGLPSMLFEKGQSDGFPQTRPFAGNRSGLRPHPSRLPGARGHRPFRA